ncbi:MAG: restriction endonuclease [Microcystis sp. M53603_WE2]|jgi:restriction system protein|uniref:Restriction endonuclease n=1 Tax=Microcystis aeruginosa 11-30S32 TaxID=2358142 RepID=A0A510PLG3_MICAE|nr:MULTISPECIES: restriction endonuclease [Microcystis]MCE2663105.1 restriction endonuclease [Microcystis sp. 53602_E8]MDJ0527114.1 restriction endonuclease [Microcystis sp. M53600_WE12]MDJ0546710.1 restriction endonuclease [Microcystis sp. M53601_WE4]MDJ0563634.1 restriction endonuclease [Microcystis sp. M49629_WE12]MDJ0538687.1 restriction endonuclease [Microcystis sp. M53603_WE2]
MPIPDFQSIMLPLLKILADGKVYKYREIFEALVREFQVTEAERKEMLPSGQQEIFANRVGWAKTYLKKAGLIESPQRATFVISEKGKEILSQNLDHIDTKFLRQFPEFQEFTRVNKQNETITLESNLSTSDQEQNPEELLENSYQEIRQALATDLLSILRKLSPDAFEKLVVELLVKMGYGGSIRDAGKAVGKSGDQGIDGIIKEDRLGLDIIYIQAKRWADNNAVGRPEIQKFVGALAGQGAKKGIFITTSYFTQEALEYAPRNEIKIVLIDGEELGQLMIDYNLGVSTQKIYEIKRIDHDYFGDE